MKTKRRVLEDTGEILYYNDEVFEILEVTSMSM